METKQIPRPLLRSSYRWHRLLGLCLALPVLALAITGIMLNHAEHFKLQEIELSSPFVLELYGMKPNKQMVSFKAGRITVTKFSDRLFIDSTPVFENSSELVGAITLDTFILAAYVDSLVLIDPISSDILEIIGTEALPPGRINTIKTHGKNILIDTTEGRFSFDQSLSEFTKESREQLNLQKQVSTPSQIEEGILQSWRGPGVTMLKLVRDIHSGAIFGALGVWFTDLLALALVFLVATGVVNSYFRR